MTKTVVELDLQGYSDVARELEEHLSAEVVLKFNDQLQEFVDAGLSSIAVSREAAVMADTGDGAILAFDDADTAHSFAEAVHSACRVHNKFKTVAAAQRWFRIGIATGELAIDSTTQPPRIGGIVIARAKRLETAATIGEVVIDLDTYVALDVRYKALYGPEEVIRGKRQEQFRAHRYTVVHGISPTEATPELESTDLAGNKRHEPPRVTDYHKDSRAVVPRFLTQFIGREEAVQSVEKIFSQTRLLTLTGTGGIGKTRLAARVADAIERTCTDGVCWIDLAPLSDPALVIQTVASELGVREQPGVNLLDTLLNALATKQAVVVLDGCEHLVDACAELVEGILHKCPRVNVLVTSNEPLRLPGETLWSVPPLAVPDIQLAEDDLQLRRNEAISLFVDRATRADPSFAATEAIIRDVAQVCQRLDGIPLAIELAASRVRLLSVKEILDKLEHLFRLLTGGERRTVPRHQTLRATVEWSYELATAEGKLLFNRLGAFAGGWTLEAAEKICSDKRLIEADILDVLGRLVDKSLVVKIPSENNTTRYRLLETLRHYAVDRLISTGEVKEVRRRHATFYLELAERAHSLLRGQDQVNWLRRLEDEHENLRAAFEWWKTDQPKMALRFAGALGRFWHMRGYWTEGRTRLSPLLDIAEATEPTEVRAKALVACGHLAFLQRDFSEAQRRYEEALSIRRKLGDPSKIADALHRVGILAEVRQEYDLAWQLQTESLSIGRGYAGANLLADILHHLGGLEDLRGNAERAQTLKQESLDLRQTTGDRWGEAWSLLVQGNERKYHGDYVGARDLYERALDIYEMTGDKRRIAYLINKLGVIYLDSGDLRAAEDAFGKSLTHARELGIQEEIADACANLGRVAHARGALPAGRRQLEESIELLKSGAPENDEQNYDLVNAWPGYYDVGSRIEVVADATHSLGLISLDQRNIDGAHQLFRESFDLLRSSKKASPGRASDDARYLDGSAFVAAARGDHRRALQLAGAADAIRERFGARLPPGSLHSNRLRLSTSWQTLGPVAQNEWFVGRAMSSVDAVALAESITARPNQGSNEGAVEVQG